MNYMRIITITAIIISLTITAFGLCSCSENGDDNTVVPKVFKGKWEMCGLAPKDKDMTAENILTGDALRDEYGLAAEPEKLRENTVEFSEGGGMAPDTDGSIPGISTKTITRVSDTEVCYELEILEMDGKELYDDPINMNVHARIADDYLFVWEEYPDTDEYDESDTYQVYEKVN